MLIRTTRSRDRPRNVFILILSTTTQANVQNAVDHKAVYIKLLEELKTQAQLNSNKLRADGSGSVRDVQQSFWIGLHDQLYERGFASEKSPYGLSRGESARKNWQWSTGQVGGGYVRWEEYPSAALRNVTTNPDARLWQERLALAALRNDPTGEPYTTPASGRIGDVNGHGPSYDVNGWSAAELNWLKQ